MKVKINYKLQEDKDVLSQILEHRNLQPGWMDAGEQDLLDFSVARNYEKGRDLLLGHIEKQSRIGIYVD